MKEKIILQNIINNDELYVAVAALSLLDNPELGAKETVNVIPLTYFP